MKTRTRNLIALALAGFAVLIAGTYSPFGSGKPSAELQLATASKSGYETGFIASRISEEERRRFKTSEALANYIATREGITGAARQMWVAGFIKGFVDGLAANSPTQPSP